MPMTSGLGGRVQVVAGVRVQMASVGEKGGELVEVGHHEVGAAQLAGFGVAPGHADGGHAELGRPVHVVVPIADHQHRLTARVQRQPLQHRADDGRLAHPATDVIGPADHREVRVDAQPGDDASGGGFGFRGGHGQPQPARGQTRPAARARRGRAGCGWPPPGRTSCGRRRSRPRSGPGSARARAAPPRTAGRPAPAAGPDGTAGRRPRPTRRPGARLSVRPSRPVCRPGPAGRCAVPGEGCPLIEVYGAERSGGEGRRGCRHGRTKVSAGPSAGSAQRVGHAWFGPPTTDHRLVERSTIGIDLPQPQQPGRGRDDADR